MRIKYKILLVISLVIIITSLTFIAIIYRTQKKALLEGIDSKLVTAAETIQRILPENYHDDIYDKSSVSEKEFLRIVDTFNKLCVKLDLQYLWSVLVVDGKILFTSATSPSKEIGNRDHASFFEVHSNPEAFDQAFSSMKITYSSFHNKWGHGRMVLIPAYDKHGRRYCFGASMSINKVEALLEKTLRRSLMIGGAVLLAGILISFVVANTFSKPIVELTQIAEDIADGSLKQTVEVKGSLEFKSLARSINFMSKAIIDKIGELQNSRENIDITLNSIGDAVIATDHQGIITRMNPVAEKLTGWPQKEAQGRPLEEVFQVVEADGESKAENPVKQVIKEGRVVGLANDTTLLSRDGTRRQIADSAAPIRNAQGETLGVVLTFRDISDQYQMEAERRRLTAILESTSDLVATATPGGELTYLNHAGKRLLKLQDGERFSHKRIADIHPEWAFSIVENEGIPRAVQEGIWVGETALLNRDGEEIPVSQVIMGHKDKNGKLEYLSTIIRDLTERKHAEEERSRLEAQLRHAQKLETLGTLAGGIAHDFNNILTPVRGYIELALQSETLDDKLRNPLKLVLDGAKRGADLVKQILVFSGQAEQERVLLKLDLVISEVLKLVRATIPTTIDIRTRIDRDCHPVQADPTQMRQVLLNLVTNAYHAMQNQGGILEVSLEMINVDAQLARRHLNLNEGLYVRLSVSDTGCGMDQEIKERIFEPFFTTKSVGKGSGLGLSVVHGIVINLGGEITVYTEPGKGSTFSVYLPPAQGLIEEKPEEEELLIGGNEQILLIDDEKDIVAMATEMLERFGYQVSAAYGSKEALEIFKQDPNQFTLVISDQTMPHMTGIQLAKKLLEIRSDTPILLASGFGESITPEYVRKAGIRGYLKKPYSMQDLASAIRKVLEST